MIYTSNLLTGEKVRLAPISKDDMPIYHKWFSNTEFLRLLMPDVAMPKTTENELEWYEEASKSKDEYVFGIRALDDDRLLGNCSIFSISQNSRNAEVGIYIGEPSEWGNGFGSDAMNVLVRFGFMDVNLHRIELHVFGYNARAIRSYEKVGFVREAVLREALYRDGTYHDIHIMGILRPDWLAKHHPEVKAP
ncbi:MAG: GNAT family N-acetyltransferase [Anaerolineae bacterium]|jgi:RimJ/RimL family protein N-acetyltransferase|nr:GNAT family N-acetyltransferase [Anaerolineae bacterium]